MADKIPEPRDFAAFHKYDDFCHLQKSLLALDLEQEPATMQDDRKEDEILSKMLLILDEYKEQAYLLDPYLESLITPVADSLKSYTKSFVSEPSKVFCEGRIRRIASLLYHYIRFRGHKTTIKYFPHEIADVSIVLDYMRKTDSLARSPSQWPLRYTLLLWLSLIVMIPFDLTQFDPTDKQGKTASSIELLGEEFLAVPGVESDSAALLLFRFFIRKDCFTRYLGFLDRSMQLLKSSENVFMAIGTLSVLAAVTKYGSAEQTQDNARRLFQIADLVQSNSLLCNNSAVRKLTTKLRTRIVLRFLPAKRSHGRQKGITLGGTSLQLSEAPPDKIVINDDTAELVEGVLEQLLSSLQDKDTIIRWTAAKAIARLSERLPSDFSLQVLETILECFSIHSVTAASLYDMPSIAEATWHGACLGCAEMARRSLVPPSKLTELMSWLTKALYFDIRKGSHSIGSNVRDAASYVLWALARTQTADTLKPHAISLARALVTASLFDREVHIRRAASAAFQEHVGRMSLLPHGIDILRKTDFYAVSLRRNAFLVAAPQVAEHIEYRQGLVDHLLTVTVRHWDPTMRQAGAESLHLICGYDLLPLGQQAISSAARLLESTDVHDVHGGLLVLIEVAEAYKSASLPREMTTDVFKKLALVPSTLVLGARNGLVTTAACTLIRVTITEKDIRLKEKSVVPTWQAIIEFGLKHRSEDVQEAAARAMGAISRLVDCSKDVLRLTKELQKGVFTKQQALGRLFGAIDYKMNPSCLQKSIQCLLNCVDRSSSPMKLNIEARRNCYSAMSQIVTRSTDQILPVENFNQFFDALLDGLDDYTVDERGDVGSWIRIVCMQGLCTFIEVACSSAYTNNLSLFQPEQFHKAIGGILKQGVERLDNVRQTAGEVFNQLFQLDTGPFGKSWMIEGVDVFRKRLYSHDETDRSWRESTVHFPRAVYFLDIARYRRPVLAGLVSSIGSKTDITQRSSGASLVQYTLQLSMSGENYTSVALVNDLLDMAKAGLTSNNIVVPIFQTFTVLLEAAALEAMSADLKGVHSLKVLLNMVTRNVQRVKNVQRVIECMKITCQLLRFKELYVSCSEAMKDFLSHPFPRIRSETAEYLYDVLQTRDIGRDTAEMDEILLETEWLDAEQAEEATTRLADIFRREE